MQSPTFGLHAPGERAVMCFDAGLKYSRTPEPYWGRWPGHPFPLIRPLDNSDVTEDDG